MSDKVGKYEFVIESAACDFNGKAPLAYLCNIFLNAAGLHADERGFGYTNLLPQGKVWVISRIGIYMKSYPVHDETIQVETWVETIEKYFTRRCFALYDGNGNEIGHAQTIWAAIDLNTRRPCNILDLGSCIVDYLGADKEFPYKKMDKISAVEEDALFLHSPTYTDIDINQHFNSVRYIERILDMFDFNLFVEKEVRQFEIVYMNEARPGTPLSFHKKEQADSTFVVDIKDVKKQASTCRASVVFG